VLRISGCFQICSGLQKSHNRLVTNIFRAIIAKARYPENGISPACKTPIVSSILTPASNSIPFNTKDLCWILSLQTDCSKTDLIPVHSSRSGAEWGQEGQKRESRLNSFATPSASNANERSYLQRELLDPPFQCRSDCREGKGRTRGK